MPQKSQKNTTAEKSQFENHRDLYDVKPTCCNYCSCRTFQQSHSFLHHPAYLLQFSGIRYSRLCNFQKMPTPLRTTTHLFRENQRFLPRKNGFWKNICAAAWISKNLGRAFLRWKYAVYWNDLYRNCFCFRYFIPQKYFVFEQTNGKTPPHKNADIGFFHHEIGLLILSANLRKFIFFDHSRKYGDFWFFLHTCWESAGSLLIGTALFSFFCHVKITVQS